MAERLELLLELLPKIGFGWLGIFIVTIIIIALLWVLEKVTQKKKLIITCPVGTQSQNNQAGGGD